MIFPFRPLARALLPAAVVLLCLWPLFFWMAEGSELLEMDGYLVDAYGLILYAIFLVALVSGIVFAYRRI